MAIGPWPRRVRFTTTSTFTQHVSKCPIALARSPVTVHACQHVLHLTRQQTGVYRMLKPTASKRWRDENTQWKLKTWTLHVQVLACDLVNRAHYEHVIDKASTDRLDHSVQCCADIIRELVMVIREGLLVLSDSIELVKMTFVRP